MHFKSSLNLYHGHLRIHQDHGQSLQKSAVPHAIDHHHPQKLAELLRGFCEAQLRSGLADRVSSTFADVHSSWYCPCYQVIGFIVTYFQLGRFNESELASESR